MKKHVSKKLFISLLNRNSEYAKGFYATCLKNELFKLDKTKIIDSSRTKCDNMFTRFSSQLFVEGLDSSSF